MPRVTLKSIAEQAGVSVATVSMALRGDGRVARTTIAEIKDLAGRLGYLPDPLLASLASRRFRPKQATEGLPLALLEFPIFEGSPIYSTDYRPAILAEAHRLGYAPQVHTVSQIARHRNLARSLYQRGVHAIIITGQPPPGFLDGETHWERFTLAQCGRYHFDLPVHTVRPHITQALHLAFEEVRRRGYRRIGFALGLHRTLLEDDLSRLGTALVLLDQEIKPRNRVPPYRGQMHDRNAICEWARQHPADAYIGFGSGTWYILRDQLGIVCPRDAGFVALHAQPLDAQKEDIPVSGLDQRREEIARQTVQLIDQMIRHGERGTTAEPRQLLIPSRWIEGATLRPRPYPGIPADTRDRELSG